MPRPIFIIGSPRSGTSVLTWAIGQHPNIALQPETNWIPMIAEAAAAAFAVGTARGRFGQLSNAGMPFEAFAAHFGHAIDAVSRECFERRIEQFWPGFRQLAEPPTAWQSQHRAVRLIHHPAEPKARWIDGTPEYSTNTCALDLLFPECQFIHILRAPAEVVNSLLHFENAGEHGHNFDVETALDTWVTMTESSREAAEAFGAARVLRVDHADLTRSPEAMFRRIFAFLGEEHCPRALGALQERINSSRASDRQQATDAMLARARTFEQARALHQELLSTAVPETGNSDIRDAMRARFKSHHSESAGGLGALLRRFMPSA
jgi:hypothetical protein